MTVWIPLIGFLLLALAIIIIPLFRYRAENTQSQNKNITVYKAQLRELEADQKNGLLSETEAASARLEIERRLLKAAENNESLNSQNKNISTTLMTVVIAVILLFSAWFYLKIGMPAMPDFALSDQDHSIARRAEKNDASINMVRQVADLNAHLINNPEDTKAWRALGQYQSELQNRPEAAQAYQHWYELEPDNIDAAVVYAESLIIFSDGRVGPAAVLVLNRGRNIQSHNPGVRHYLALAEYQAGNISQALASWKSLKAESKPDAPWLRPLKKWIRQAEKDLGLKSAAGEAMNDAQRAAIRDMSPEQQADMIKSMVAGLQEKMDKNPTNIEGWFQLAKSYEVLGQREKAIGSLVQALKYAPDDMKPQIKKQLEILLKQE